MFLNTNFGKTVDILHRAMTVATLRREVISNNIANADTPNFKARDLDFAAILGGTQGETPLPVTVTDGAHFTMQDGEVPAGTLQYRNPYQSALDGNTVEMSVEQAAFSENNVRYQASLNFINTQIKLLLFAIAGQ